VSHKLGKPGTETLQSGNIAVPQGVVPSTAHWFLLPHVMVEGTRAGGQHLHPRGRTKRSTSSSFFYLEEICAFERDSTQAAYMETCVEDDEIALRMDVGRRPDAARRQRVRPYQSPMEDRYALSMKWYRCEMGANRRFSFRLPGPCHPTFPTEPPSCKHLDDLSAFLFARCVKFASSHFAKAGVLPRGGGHCLHGDLRQSQRHGTDHALPRHACAWRSIVGVMSFFRGFMRLLPLLADRDDAQLHEQRLIAAFLVGGSMMISRNGQPGTNKGQLAPFWPASVMLLRPGRTRSLPAWWACCPAWGRLRR
jgi:hypothetical protein